VHAAAEGWALLSAVMTSDPTAGASMSATQSMQSEGTGAAQEPAEWLGLAANVVGALPPGWAAQNSPV
jgi:hypothetical protein